MTSTNLRKAEDAAATVSAIISFFIGLELIAIIVLVYIAPSGFGLSIIILGIIGFLYKKGKLPMISKKSK